MSHAFLTIAIPLESERTDPVNARLDSLGNPASDRVRDALRGQGVHFMSITVLPRGEKHSAQLVLESTLDGDEAAAIERVVSCFGTILAEVLEAGGHSVAPDDLAVFLERHRHQSRQTLFGTPGVNFAGTPGMTVGRIRREYELARKCREILDRPPFELAALDRLEQVRDVIAKDSDFAALLEPEDALLLQPARGDIPIAALAAKGILAFAWPVLLLIAVLAVASWVAGEKMIGPGWGLGAAFVALLMGVFALAGLGASIYFRLRKLEASDRPDDSAPDLARLTQVQDRENRTEQNHLAGVSVIKPGFLRPFLLRVVFWAIANTAKRSFRPGFLGELGTIHFARWIVLPGTDKLLFFSNFGGSWESYLEDFITKAHNGLTGVWSNTVGFPRTKNLFQDGATDGDRFKRWARRQQRPTRFWYSAYPYLTTTRVRNNAAIRLGLASASTEDEAVEWLNRFGSLPPRPDTVESSDVQSILFGGFKPLPFGACLAAQLPDDAAQARAWLAGTAGAISFGNGPLPDCVTQLALTHTGLDRLGLPAEFLHTFPVAFTHGMESQSRASILGDTGDDKPSGWAWGNDETRADVAILIYHRTNDELGRVLESNRSRLARSGGSVVYEIPMRPLTPEPLTREPFGFADGISQPRIRGISRGQTERDELHSVEPGEFILGYHDNRGNFSPTPTVPATADPENLLTTIGIASDEGAPRPGASRANSARDLGRNGSFLVIRQLQQDVDGFNAFLEQAAAHLKASGHPGVPAALDEEQMAEWLAAKMVGRWRDGTSLIRFPNRPGTGWDGKKKAPPDNAFRFGDEDPLGHRVPLGAHIRRGNPRRSLAPDSPEQISISNRHRILRVGRPYGPDEKQLSKQTPVGLLFMCLNADIERQFEFVQQTWLMARHFHGLDGEVDSIVGRGGKGGRLTIPTSSGPVPVSGMQDFVTVRGGGYFFLPSRRAIRYLSRMGPAES